jgi:hypothetical protein
VCLHQAVVSECVPVVCFSWEPSLPEDTVRKRSRLYLLLPGRAPLGFLQHTRNINLKLNFWSFPLKTAQMACLNCSQLCPLCRSLWSETLAISDPWFSLKHCIQAIKKSCIFTHMYTHTHTHTHTHTRRWRLEEGWIF